MRDIERSRAIFCGMPTPPIPQFQSIAQDLHTRPGKWMRAGLFLLAVRSAGDITPKHHAVAAAIEMVHNASLLHDDVLDEAALRRHADSANARCGNRAAILFGDILLSGAFKLASESGLPDACGSLSQIIQCLCHGEALQACVEDAVENITPKFALSVIEKKTASFTRFACRCGHILGNGEPTAADRLGDFGRDLGMAYQLADDLLDIVGSEQAEGKTLGTDLTNHRPTLPLAFLIQREPEQAVKLLFSRDHSALATLLRTSGALAAAAAQALEFIEQSRRSLAEAERASPSSLNNIRPSFDSIPSALAQKLKRLTP